MKRPKATDATKAFEAALAAEPQKDAVYCLRLFITGPTPRCLRAIKNIRAICDTNLAGRYDLEVIDIYQHPEQAKPEQIVATPTLIKRMPLPLRKIIGDFSDSERVLTGLDITRTPLSAHPLNNEHVT